jgi:outer membrane protein
VRQAEANLTAAHAGVRAAKVSAYLPTLSAGYSRSGNGFDSRYGLGPDVYPCPTAGDPARVCPGYTYSGALRFSLSFPLFNQYAREAAAIRADVAEENAEAALRDARLAAQQNLVQYLGTLRTAEQRVAIQEASVAAAEEDLRVQRQRYALGASTLLDVLTSQTQLDQSRAALIQARYDARVAKAQLESLVGKDL